MPVLRSVTALAVLVGAAFVPFAAPIKAPSTLTAGVLKGVYAPEDGQLTIMRAEVGARVFPGAIIAQLTSPRLEIDRVVQTTRAASLQQVSHGQFGTPETLAGARKTERDFHKALADLRFTEARARGLTVRASDAGRVVEVAPDLERGQWVSRDQLIARVSVGKTPEAVAYIEERSLGAVSIGDQAEFHLEGRLGKPTVWRVASVATRPESFVSDPALGSTYGGMVPTRKDTEDRLMPLTPIYRVAFVPADDELQLPNMLRQYGWMSLRGERLSVAERLQRYASAGLKRLQIGS